MRITDELICEVAAALLTKTEARDSEQTPAALSDVLLQFYAAVHPLDVAARRRRRSKFLHDAPDAARAAAPGRDA